MDRGGYQILPDCMGSGKILLEQCSAVGVSMSYGDGIGLGGYDMIRALTYLGSYAIPRV